MDCGSVKRIVTVKGQRRVVFVPLAGNPSRRSDVEKDTIAKLRARQGYCEYCPSGPGRCAVCGADHS